MSIQDLCNSLPFSVDIGSLRIVNVASPYMFHTTTVILFQINTIANIRHSAFKGDTVLLCQTDRIHESFYDLFNQRFRCIHDRIHGPRYYANIAIGAHSKPSRVEPTFQCVVVLKRSEIKDTPLPFLNRFEKYFLSYKAMLHVALGYLPPCLRIVVETGYTKVIGIPTVLIYQLC